LTPSSVGPACNNNGTRPASKGSTVQARRRGRRALTAREYTPLRACRLGSLREPLPSRWDPVGRWTCRVGRLSPTRPTDAPVV
jgi:hypothetical protein